jgi:hypothetical protein
MYAPASRYKRILRRSSFSVLQLGDRHSMGFVTGRAPAAALRYALGKKAAACIYIL